MSSSLGGAVLTGGAQAVDFAVGGGQLSTNPTIDPSYAYSVNCGGQLRKAGLVSSDRRSVNVFHRVTQTPASTVRGARPKLL
ncbi:hypothetical protein AFM11_14570 [Mycolicibacterium wolinskyi]|uniref:Uncharacterized protein n=1 Tax=Mycolicibacterium wolinskyi TaxID=59750 RepID=A0A132PMD2_9MYCO|nr:hypothetical protein AFM11_14570 [Mycolicibacterium wolinskyi]